MCVCMLMHACRQQRLCCLSCSISLLIFFLRWSFPLNQWFIDWARLPGQETPQLSLLSTETTAECPHAWFLQGCWGLNSVPRVYLSLDLTSQGFRHLHLAHWRPGFLYMNFWELIQTTFNPEQRVYNSVVTLSGKVLELRDGSGLKNTYCYCRGSLLVTRTIRDPTLSSSLHMWPHTHAHTNTKEHASGY